jgi:transposase
MRRHAWHLSNDQRSNLGQYLSQYPVLKAIYRIKQRLNRLLLRRTMNMRTAKRQLPRLLRLLDQLKVSPLRGLANTPTSWLEAIVGMWRFSKTNGITEGFHTKMEMISRRAYSFRNFENYRLRVLTHCGWNGIINRV